MKVYLVRHGDAVSSGVDPQRPLSEQGRADVRKVASFIKPLGISVEHIWHSGKLRAAQTTEILADSVKAEKGCSEHEALGPNDDVTVIADELDAYNTDIMIVGHLPYLAYLASLLTAGSETADVAAFDAGSIACLNRGDPGRWRIEWMIAPKNLT
ncbi:MAG: phosphohistidine phosphatase SixA [Sedimentisphaerales bacterium]|nr:phosphohistidine phosphatase SixA [Sedimentisphaerales bacterium]